jgi:hypothetical protein
MFLQLLSRLRSEHAKFRLWVKTYGFSIEVMKFIKNLTEGSFAQVTGNYLAPILNEMTSSRKVETPKIIESEVAALQEEVSELLDRTSDLYLKPGTRRERSTASSVVPEIKSQLSALNSKVVTDFSAISRLFDGKIASLKLLFRASENAYSIREFHKKCDGHAGTLVVV